MVLLGRITHYFFESIFTISYILFFILSVVSHLCMNNCRWNFGLGLSPSLDTIKNMMFGPMNKQQNKVSNSRFQWSYTKSIFFAFQGFDKPMYLLLWYPSSLKYLVSYHIGCSSTYYHHSLKLVKRKLKFIRHTINPPLGYLSRFFHWATINQTWRICILHAFILSYYHPKEPLFDSLTVVLRSNARSIMPGRVA
jgi:hypothetical protein